MKSPYKIHFRFHFHPEIEFDWKISFKILILVWNEFESIHRLHWRCNWRQGKCLNCQWGTSDPIETHSTPRTVNLVRLNSEKIRNLQFRALIAIFE